MDKTAEVEFCFFRSPSSFPTNTSESKEFIEKGEPVQPLKNKGIATIIRVEKVVNLYVRAFKDGRNMGFRF